MWKAERSINIWSEAECKHACQTFLIVPFGAKEKQNEERGLNSKHANQLPFPRQYLPFPMKKNK